MSDMGMSGRIAEEIRARLARNNVTKSELARRLNVSHTWVTNRLIGNQEIGTSELQRIADALGVSYGDLLPRQARESSLSWKIPTARRHPAVEAIKSYLEEQGISQSELARRLGWGRMVVQRRLSGDADLTVAELEQIARALDVPVTRFLPADVEAAAS